MLIIAYICIVKLGACKIYFELDAEGMAFINYSTNKCLCILTTQIDSATISHPTTVLSS